MKIEIRLKLMYEKTETKTYHTNETELVDINNLIIILIVITFITLTISILNVGLTCGQLLINGGFRREEAGRDSRKGKRRRRNRQHRQSHRVGGRSQHREEPTTLALGLQRSIGRNREENFSSDDFTSDNLYINI